MDFFVFKGTFNLPPPVLVNFPLTLNLMFDKTTFYLDDCEQLKIEMKQKKPEESELALYSSLEELSLKSMDIHLPCEHMLAKNERPLFNSKDFYHGVSIRESKTSII